MKREIASLDRATIKAKLRKLVLIAVYGEDVEVKLEDTASIKSIGLDSMSVMDLLLGLESEFGIEIDETEFDISHLESVMSLTNYVCTELGANRS